MSLVVVTVTGTWQDYGETAAEGSVTFTPYGWRNVPADPRILSPVPTDATLNAGTAAVQLVAPNDPGDAEVRYKVAVSLRSAGAPVVDSYDVVMPVVSAEGAYLDVSSRDPATNLLSISSEPVPVTPPPTVDVWS